MRRSTRAGRCAGPATNLSSARFGRTAGWPVGPAASWPTTTRAAPDARAARGGGRGDPGLVRRVGETDRSHRKLAHRGSYLGRCWVSPSSVRRVLSLADKHFRPLPRPGRSVRKPFPDWVTTPRTVRPTEPPPDQRHQPSGG